MARCNHAAHLVIKSSSADHDILVWCFHCYRIVGGTMGSWLAKRHHSMRQTKKTLPVRKQALRRLGPWR
jgi:hypothetical protein